MIDFRNMDCMELMAEYEDNHFDLAIVDPPYGIKAFEKGFKFRDNGKKTMLVLTIMFQMKSILTSFLGYPKTK